MSSHDKELPGKAAARHANGISRPAAGMLLAAAASVVLLGALAGFLLYPVSVKQDELEMMQAEKVLALQAALQRKAFERVDPEELAALLRRVPTRPEREPFILTLQEIGRQTGVEIVSMAPPSGAGAQAAQVPAILDSLTGGSDAQQSNAPAPASASAQSQGGGLYDEIRYKLELKGNWRQTTDFVREIGALERLVAVPEWRMAEEPSVANAAWQERPMTSTVVVVLYAGTGYESKFPGVTGGGMQGGDDE